MSRFGFSEYAVPGEVAAGETKKVHFHPMTKLFKVHSTGSPKASLIKLPGGSGAISIIKYDDNKFALGKTLARKE